MIRPDSGTYVYVDLVVLVEVFQRELNSSSKSVVNYFS
jgi:hypothetical protein